MTFTEPQIEALAPKESTYKAALKIVNGSKCQDRASSERALWGSIQGSGKKPYTTQVDIQELAYKCSCPSRQFPCKHALAILILHSREAAIPDEEPEWVSEWINKRRAKATPEKKEKKPLTEKELASRQKSKDKRAAERIISVNSGIDELEKWLHDQVRIGLLELPNRPKDDFEKLAARMVDAKASGLAGLVRALGEVDYGNMQSWQEEATELIAKMNLLIKSWKNRDNLNSEWQQTLKTLIGWSQSSKELKTNKTAKAIKDEWLVLGRELKQKEDILIQREWLWGCQSGESVLYLNFGTRFQKLESCLPLASVIEAEVAYFQSILPHRGIIRLQNSISNLLKHKPSMLKNISSMTSKHLENLRLNPWANQLCYLVENLRIIKKDGDWYLLDNTKYILKIRIESETVMKWFLYCGNQPVSAALVYKKNAVKILGIFSDTKYFSLC